MFYNTELLKMIFRKAYDNDKMQFNERELNAMYAIIIDASRNCKASRVILDFLKERYIDGMTYKEISVRHNYAYSTCVKAINDFLYKIRRPMYQQWFFDGLADNDVIYFKKYYELTKSLGFNVFYGDSRNARYVGSIEYLTDNVFIQNALLRRGINTIGDLVRLRDKLDGHYDKKLRGIGVKQSIELNEALLDYV